MGVIVISKGLITVYTPDGKPKIAGYGFEFSPGANGLEQGEVQIGPEDGFCASYDQYTGAESKILFSTEAAADAAAAWVTQNANKRLPIARVDGSPGVNGQVCYAPIK